MASPLAAVMIGSLILYVLFGGADYGAGFWDLLCGGPLKDQQKRLIANAIRPIWEANHVWLILILVLLFAGFPRAFGAIMTALYVPLFFLLLGIVLRGSSFVFRAYATQNSDLQRACAWVFSASSSLTPIVAGMLIASVSDDRLLVADDQSLNGYLFNWLNPFSFSVGLFALALFASLAAAYLAVEAPDANLRQSFCHRAIAAELATACLAALVFLLTGRYAHGLRASLLDNSLAQVAEAVSAVSLLGSLFALARQHVRLARLLTIIFVTAIIFGWAAAQYPFIARPGFTIANSVLSETVVRAVFYASLAGAVVLFPSLALLLYIFKDQRREQSTHPSQGTGTDAI